MPLRVSATHFHVHFAQCIFELWNAIKLGYACELSIIMTPEDKAAFKAAVQRDGYGVVDHAFDGIRAEEAEAWSADDLARITLMVQSSAGGFATLNATVKQHLARWFQAAGGIKVTSRMASDASQTSSIGSAMRPTVSHL